MRRTSVKSTFGRKSTRMSEKIARAAERGALVSVSRAMPSLSYSAPYGRRSLQEIKFFDCRVATPSIAGPYGLFNASTPPVAAEPGIPFTGITCLNEVVQGATSYNRIGAKIVIKSVHIRFNLVLDGASAKTSNARVMVVHDHQPNGAYPVFSDILSDNISTIPDFGSSANMANKDRFTVLRNMFYNLSINGQRGVMVDEHIKCRIETMYKSSTGTIGDITTGAIYLVAFADYSAAASYTQINDMQVRVRFYD